MYVDLLCYDGSGSSQIPGFVSDMSMMRGGSNANVYSALQLPVQAACPGSHFTSCESESFGSLGFGRQETMQSREMDGGNVAPMESDNRFDIITDSDYPANGLDFTAYPAILDKAYEKFDVGDGLKATIISAGNEWKKRSQKTILDSPTDILLMEDELEHSKIEAFDLLDALSRSGALVMNNSSLHVILAATHSFDSTLMDTIVQNNVNPIEHVERSSLIMASSIFHLPAADLVLPSQLSRVSMHSPQLIKNGNSS